MAKTSSMYIRIDPQVKSDVETIYSRYGMSITVEALFEDLNDDE